MKKKSALEVAILLIGSMYIMILFAALAANTMDMQIKLGLASLTFAIPLGILLIISNKR